MGDLEVGLVAVAVDAECRVEVGVSERLRCGVDAGDAPEFGGEDVAGEVHVEPVGDSTADEACAMKLSVPPAVNGVGTWASLGVGADREHLLAFGAAAVVDPPAVVSCGPAVPRHTPPTVWNRTG